MLSDFHIINRSLINYHLTAIIDEFQCLSDNINQLFSVQWTIDYQSRSYINEYILYYLDTTENNDELIRRLVIPSNFVSINKQRSYDLYKYEFNNSLFDLNYNPNHILKLHLAIVDHNENHLPMTQPAIYCTLTKEYGRKCKFSFFLSSIIYSN